MPALALALCLAPLASTPAGDDPEWGGFRGNNGAGVDEAARIPDTLDADANLAWRTEIPPGYSSPIVAGERVFLTGAAGARVSTLCVERGTGAIVWQRSIDFDGRRVGANSPAAPSPATDGERVYALFHSAGLVAYDLSGQELWRAAPGPFDIPHGLATSPVLHGGLVLLQVDQDSGSYLLAVDARTGEERWKVDRPGAMHGYATPAVYAPADGPAQVVVSGSFQIAGYSLADGAKRWWVDGAAWQAKALPVFEDGRCIVNASMAPSTEFGLPRLTQTWEEALAERDADGDGRIGRSEWQHDMMQRAWFLFDLDGDDVLDERDYDYLGKMDTATGALFALRLDGRGDVSASHVEWKLADRRGLPDMPSPVCVDGTLFLVKDGGILTSVDPETGAIRKQARVGTPDDYAASPVGGGGRLVLASRSGQLTVVTAVPEWEELSSTDLGEELWATPAIAGPDVLVRTGEALYCFRDADQ